MCLTVNPILLRSCHSTSPIATPPKSNMTQESIATRLQAARDLAGLSQGQAAKLLGISRNEIAEMEAGKDTPSEALLTRVAEVYVVSESWLRGEVAYQLSMDDIRRNRHLAEQIEKLEGSAWEQVGQILAMTREK